MWHTSTQTHTHTEKYIFRKGSGEALSFETPLRKSDGSSSQGVFLISQTLPLPTQGNTDRDLGKPCTSDSRSQPLKNNVPSEAGRLHVRLQEPMPAPSSGPHKDNLQEAVPPKPRVTAEEKKAPPVLPSALGPRTHKDR